MGEKCSEMVVAACLQIAFAEDPERRVAEIAGQLVAQSVRYEAAELLRCNFMHFALFVYLDKVSFNSLL